MRVLTQTCDRYNSYINLTRGLDTAGRRRTLDELAAALWADINNATDPANMPPQWPPPGPPPPPPPAAPGAAGPQ